MIWVFLYMQEHVYLLSRLPASCMFSIMNFDSFVSKVIPIYAFLSFMKLILVSLV